MRIGIFIKEFERLENWEFRIIDGIRKDTKLELCLLIQDKRLSNRNGKSELHQFRQLNLHKRSFGELVLKMQMYIERKFFFKKINTANKKCILNYLNTNTTLKVEPYYKNEINCLITEDLKKIKEFNLDILLNQGFYNIKGEIISVAKHGIWSILHSDNFINHNGSVGFWELLNNQPAYEVALQQISIETKDNMVIDMAYFSPHWSLVRTKDLILEGSVSLLLKNLRKLSKGINIDGNVRNMSISEYTAPNLSDVLKYCFSFYFALSEKVFKAINSILFGVKYQRWTLFFGKGDFLKTELSKLKPVRLPKEEFWADPFLFCHESKNYVFFEAYCYKTKKGKISCGIIQKDSITNVVDVLDLDYHLSYPYIFEEEGEIYLMPETLENKRLEIYKCTHFPNKWELYTTAFEGEMVADASFYNDKEGQKWLFINKKEIRSLPMNNELYIYQIDSVKLDNLESHIQNPVIIDSRTARNGGAIFSYGNEIFRPSQRNVEGIYGRALNINKIKELTINSYIEENSMIFKPEFLKGLMSMHHLHQVEDLFVFDAAFRKK